MLSALSEWVTEVIDALGYVGVALLIALENLFPPIPSEIVLPFAGFVASDRGGLALVGMVIAATVGSLMGAWILYGLARWIGRERLGRFVVRYGRWLRLTTGDVDRAERWFDRREVVALLVGRCVPLVRSLVSIPAGFSETPFWRFTVYTAIGSSIWNTVLIVIGYVLRDNWEDVEPALDWFQYVVVALVAAAIGWFIWRRRFSAHARAQS